MKRLTAALSNDPDLANVAAATHSKVLQTPFVVTGCDYISFFSGLGKATFLRYFFQHAEFITGESQYTKGSLSDTLLDNDVHKQGFLAFLRLIGTVYFKKHVTAFASNSPSPTSRASWIHQQMSKSNTGTGWRTFAKTLGNKSILRLKWFPPLKLCDGIGSVHVGWSTCGGRRTEMQCK